MPSLKKRLVPGVEPMESKALLSAATPVLTMHELNAVVQDVEQAIKRYDRTQNVGQASAALTRISARIPSGTTQLNPTWQLDLANYASGKAAPGTVLKREIIQDLYADVFQGVHAGTFRVIGAGSTVFSVNGPAPPGAPSGTTPGAPSGTTPGAPSGTTPGATQYSEDSVHFDNQTGMTLTLFGILNPTSLNPVKMTATIGSDASDYYFNFGSSTGDAIEVATINGQTIDYLLPTPCLGCGYNGELFTITYSLGYYTISAG